MSEKTIWESLSRIGRRRTVQRTLEGAATGFLIGGLVAVVAVGIRLLGFAPHWPLVALFAGPVLFGGLLGAVIGRFLTGDPRDSARQLDRHYRLKDRVLTAWTLLRRRGKDSEEPTPIERLQIADAAERLRGADPRSVQPLRTPRNLSRAIVAVAVAALLTVSAPFFRHETSVQAAMPVEEIVDTVALIQEELLEPLQELAKENPEEQPIVELNEKLKELLKKLEEANTDPKEALATLSQMESAIAKAQGEFNLEAMDASLDELADALGLADATRSAASALKEGNYSKAADALEKTDTSNLSKQERKALGEQLKNAAGNMNKRNQQKLAKATEKLGECMNKGDCDGSKESACEIAGMCRSQGLRKGICQSLGAKLSLLGLCKSECSGACNSNKDGGNGTQKSDQASKNWGTGASGDPRTGAETDLGGKRELKQLSGMQGTGPSEYETVKSDETSEETTARSYRDTYKEYQKMSESVLESEPIPLGQRQMIRRYFEAIRPHENTE